MGLQRFFMQLEQEDACQATGEALANGVDFWTRELRDRAGLVLSEMLVPAAHDFL